MFRLLLGELRKLGCTIVYADFNQIIMCTGKHSLDSTYSYVESLSASLAQRDLFKHVILHPEAAPGSSSPYWHSLAFHDLYNLGGITGTEAVERNSQVRAPPAVRNGTQDRARRGVSAP